MVLVCFFWGIVFFLILYIYIVYIYFCLFFFLGGGAVLEAQLVGPKSTFFYNPTLFGLRIFQSINFFAERVETTSQTRNIAAFVDGLSCKPEGWEILCDSFF